MASGLEPGLATNGLTWLIFGGLFVTWLGSAFLFKPAGVNWLRGWGTSLFGLAWVGFGLQIVLRFILLSHDSFLFGDMSDRLAIRPAAVVNLALKNAWLYWMAVTIGFAMTKHLPARPLSRLRSLDARFVSERAWVFVGGASMCFVVATMVPGVPKSLITPLSVIGSLWALPAGVVWYEHYRGHPARRPRPYLRFFVLAPGLLYAAMSPYRELFLLVIGVPFLAGLFAGKRFQITKVVVAGLIVVVTITVTVNVLRRTIWAGQELGAALVEELSWSTWTDRPNTAPWVQAAGRFHAFDSLLLTVDLVPSHFPYSRRAVFTSWIIQTFVPRFFYPDKALGQRGREFSATIWAFDSKGDSVAQIAPSMLGDLYEAGGVVYIAIGALLWGALLGALHANTRGIGGAGAGLIAVFATQCTMGIERDFVLAVTTMAQMLCALFVLTVVLVRTQPSVRVAPRRWRHTTAYKAASVIGGAR